MVMGWWCIRNGSTLFFGSCFNNVFKDALASSHLSRARHACQGVDIRNGTHKRGTGRLYVYSAGVARHTVQICC